MPVVCQTELQFSRYAVVSPLPSWPPLSTVCRSRASDGRGPARGHATLRLRKPMDVDVAAPPPLRTRQVTRDLACPTTYFRVRMRGPRRPSAQLFLAALEEALLALHGAVGGAVGLTVLRFEAASGEGLVAVDARDAPKLWPAAALLTQLRGEQCTLQVLATSPSLLALANDSRAFCAALLAEEARADAS